MPVKRGQDSQGCYYRWGESGAKYHYKCGDEQAAQRAKKKAEQQGKAIYASGY